MTDSIKFSSATDKDVFDLLMSDKVKFSERSLREIGLKRGIIYSANTKRDNIATELSLLNHDFEAISHLIEKRETAKRQEKMTWVKLPVELTRAEMREIVESYQDGNSDEKLDITPRRQNDLSVHISYNEIDYSKTRLIQKSRRDASIDFVTEKDFTTIRFPATEKARSIVDAFCTEVEKKKRQNIDQSRIDLVGLDSDQRTKFFMGLMRLMKGYQLQTVIGLKVATNLDQILDVEVDIDIEDDTQELRSKELAGIVKSVAISGTNLDRSDEYQSLAKKGYFITAATWRSKQVDRPNDILQFAVSFDKAKEGIGFKYIVRVAKRVDDIITDVFEAISPLRAPSISSLMEDTAAAVLQSVKNTQPASEPEV